MFCERKITQRQGVPLAKNAVFETYLKNHNPFVPEDFLLQVQRGTRIVKEGMKMGFAEGGEFHNLPSSGESEIPHSDYRYSAGGRKKREQDQLPKGRGSIL